MCLGCREEFALAQESVQVGLYIATGNGREFFVPCLCRRKNCHPCLNCDNELHLHITLVDEDGKVQVW